MNEIYKTQIIKITSPKAYEAISRVIMDSMYIPKGSVADLTYKICRAIGIKPEYAS